MSKISYYEIYSETSVKIYSDTLLEIEKALNKNNDKHLTQTLTKKLRDYYDWYYCNVWKEFPETTSVFRRSLYMRFVICEKSKNDFLNPNDFLDDFIKNYWKEIVENHRGKLETPLEKQLTYNDKEVVKYLAKCRTIERLCIKLEDFKVEKNDTVQTIIARLENNEKNKNEFLGAKKVLGTYNEKNKGKNSPDLKLSDFFGVISKYRSFMAILVQKDLIQENTYIWKDENKGNKGLAVAIIKYLHKQSYYKDNKSLSTEEIQIVAKSTFGLTISIGTIKKSKPDNFDLKFIQPASTLL